MKKDIMELLKSENGYLRINNISYLHRWTKDALGNEVDRLELEFDTINNVNFSIYEREIKSRDYAGIISECQVITENFMTEVSKTLCNNMKAGYRNVSKKTV